MIVSHFFLIFHKRFTSYICMFKAWKLAKVPSLRGSNIDAKPCITGLITLFDNFCCKTELENSVSCGEENSLVENAPFIIVFNKNQ